MENNQRKCGDYFYFISDCTRVIITSNLIIDGLCLMIWPYVEAIGHITRQLCDRTRSQVQHSVAVVKNWPNYSQENTYSIVLFSWKYYILVKNLLLYRLATVILLKEQFFCRYFAVNFSEELFYRTPPNYSFRL